MSGELKTCEEGESFVRSETVRQVKKSEGEKNTASMRQLRGEIRELKGKMKVQDEVNEMLKAALIASMSRSMYDNYASDVKFQMEQDEIEKLEDYPLDRKHDSMSNAKHEAIGMVAVDLIYLTHPGEEKEHTPSELAVDTFEHLLSFNGYEYTDLVREEKESLYEDGEDYLMQFRLYSKCREIDWMQAIEEGRDFYDYRKFTPKHRHYFTEMQMLTGKPVPAGKEGYVIPYVIPELA